MTRAVGTLACLLMLMSVARAAALSVDEKMMGAASLVLMMSTRPSGAIQVMSDGLARSAGGATFRRLAECVYGEEQTSRRSTDLAIINFGALTGRFRTEASARADNDLLLEGGTSRTLCVKRGSRARCQRDVALTHIGSRNVRRALNDVTFIELNGCPPEVPEPN